MPAGACLTLTLCITWPAEAVAQPSSAPTVDCDRQCVTQVMDRFLAAMVAGKSTLGGAATMTQPWSTASLA